MNQGLEALLRMETHLEYYKDDYKDYAIVLKELKALEAIRSKGINWRELKLCKTVEQYNEPIIKYGLLDVKPYTQEEFDLLKEVLQKHE